MDANISSFIEITGASRAMAIDMLNLCSGNLEDALGNHFASQSMDPSENNNELNSSNPNFSPFTFTSSSFFVSVWRNLWGYVISPSAKIIRISWRVLCVIASSFFSSSSPQYSNFSVFYEARHGRNHPKFESGSFESVAAKAMTESKLIALYVHKRSSSYSDYFCSTILANSEVQNLIKDHFLCWGQEYSLIRYNELSPLNNILRYPALAILLIHSVDNVQLLYSFEGDSNVESVLMGTYKVQIGDKVRNFEIDRKLREEQDREYAESAKKDAERKLQLERNKEHEMMKSNELQRKKQNLDTTRLQTNETIRDIRAQRKLTAENLLSKDLNVCMSEIPSGEKTKIILRLPCGSRVERTFLLTQTVDDLYSWVTCCEELHKDRCDIIIPIEFQLSVPLSSTQLDKRSHTLKEAGLFPNAVVYLTSLDDTDDEA
ncbi:UBX domain-containing protein [Cardiosporidium cionae]|uniref:UBX domain-containing protein n=1 Tax=Cardiosporidium cionae TaxID=476202 RepID=A0ABQ7JED9_9APIC|nr:UBX domain-containing protein [Cardiosporidium cionae]|eukprot:KAF8822341.1 UBX domain-containing protein [Cardiosporidium cionae]